MNDFEELTTRALALPAENRAPLAELLVQSLEEREAHEITSAWLAEIWRRDQEIRAGVAVLKPAAQVLREAREFFSGSSVGPRGCLSTGATACETRETRSTSV